MYPLNPIDPQTRAVRFAVMAALPIWLAFVAVVGATEPLAPDYVADIAPLLTKYCVGCHNAQDAEGGLSLETYADMQVGVEDGPVVLPGQADSSRLIRVLTGLAEPRMPPEDNPSPNDQEIASLRSWIDAGAKGPEGASPTKRLITPYIESVAQGQLPSITALALSPDNQRLAIARFAQLDLLESVLQEPSYSVTDLPGKIHAIDFTSDGNQFLIATGIAGLYGEAQIYATDSGEKIAALSGHRDILCDAVFSPDGSIVATGSYDQTIILWSVETGEPLHTLQGHHGAIFDLAFSPDGNVLASASGDETVKVWHVSTGRRLDTLGQPEAEQYSVTFSPEGRYIVAGGADRRIRVWEYVSRDTPRINPIVVSRFAHEKAVVQLLFTPDGEALLSTSEDGAIKVWETTEFAESVILNERSEVVNDWCLTRDGKKLVVGRRDGSWQIYPVERPKPVPPGNPLQSARPAVIAESADVPAVEMAEVEPNDAAEQAQTVALPAHLKGIIQPTRDGPSHDVDLFRFAAQAGEQFIFEVDAARSESHLDSKIEILTTDGRPIERVMLQAVRDSYLTLRGQGSDTSDGFRLHNWEEMELNELLYIDGEVIKLWHYPRGPDSGFMIYPGYGNRFSCFDTTPLSHALHAPAYIVEPHPPGGDLKPTGLPIFTLYYENDDDARRKLGKDSSLKFVAPAGGEYLVRVSDARGFGDESYHYALHVRHPQPDFEVSIAMDDTTVHAGGGREFSLTVDRRDGFDGPVRVDIAGLPPGFYASTPVAIEAGQQRAYGTINVLATAPQPTAENASASSITASANVAGREVSKSVAALGELKLGEALPARVRVLPATAIDGPPNETAADPGTDNAPPEPVELVIAPGETISAIVQLDRNEDFSAEVRLGGHDAGRNLPHGVYVDNIGLSGLLVNEGSDSREFFITAAKWVPESTRRFHIRAKINDGQHSTWPVVLHVRRNHTQVASP